MEEQPQISINRIYLKDLSFESPMAPELFKGNFAPQVGLEVRVHNRPLESDVHEVVLEITATGTIDEKTAFIVEVEQAGLFTLKSLPESQRTHALQVFCPNLIFPYARTTIDNAMNAGSLPSLMLAPLNFEAMFAQQQAQVSQRPAQPADNPDVN